MMVENLVNTDVLPKSAWRTIILPAAVIALIILAGVGTGYVFSHPKAAGGGLTSIFSSGSEGGGKVAGAPQEAGAKNQDEFPDKAQGKLTVNDNEAVAVGSHQLIRPGGEDQIAYLTSSVVDLDQFAGHCVEVWGQTFATEKVGWLMDIGYVKRLDKCPEGLE